MELFLHTHRIIIVTPGFVLLVVVVNRRLLIDDETLKSVSTHMLVCASGARKLFQKILLKKVNHRLRLCKKINIMRGISFSIERIWEEEEREKILKCWNFL